MSDPSGILARMTRRARTVVPGLPHHVTQRGNRRQLTFFEPDDYDLFLRLMAWACAHHGVEIWAWCLMPNHVHLIAVPSTADGLRLAMSEAHRRYTTEINERYGWKGHLWQGRFASFVMDERHTLAAARYIELNPVRAGLVATALDYPWSSARAHLTGRDDVLAHVAPLLSRVPDWSVLLGGAADGADEELRKHEVTGRPLGTEDFVGELELRLGRALVPLKNGRPRKEATPTKIGKVSRVFSSEPRA
jgi:REP-associated tyrosine transposase